MGKEDGAFRPSPSFSLLCAHQPGSSLDPPLLGFSGASWHRHDRLNRWPQVTESTCSTSPLLDGGQRWEVPTLCSQAGATGDLPPTLGYFRTFQKSPPMNIAEDTSITTSTSQEISRSLSQEPVPENQIREKSSLVTWIARYIFLINHNVTAFFILFKIQKET